KTDESRHFLLGLVTAIVLLGQDASTMASDCDTTLVLRVMRACLRRNGRCPVADHSGRLPPRAAGEAREDIFPSSLGHRRQWEGAPRGGCGRPGSLCLLRALLRWADLPDHAGAGELNQRRVRRIDKTSVAAGPATGIPHRAVIDDIGAAVRTKPDIGRAIE